MSENIYDFIWSRRKYVVILQSKTFSVMIRYDEPVNMEWIADLICCSVRTASKRVAPLRQYLGIGKKQSLTKSQVLSYFGLEEKVKV